MISTRDKISARQLASWPTGQLASCPLEQPGSWPAGRNGARGGRKEEEKDAGGEFIKIEISKIKNENP